MGDFKTNIVFYPSGMEMITIPVKEYEIVQITQQKGCF